MANTLLSPELARVLRDIENVRSVINEKYEQNGSPTPIPAPLKSGNMAEAVRAIVTYGEVESKDGNVELSFDAREVELPDGAYKEGIHARLKDYAISYVWNMKDMESEIMYVNIGDSFTIPDFLNGETKVGHSILLGWSKMPTDETPEYVTGQVVDNFEGAPVDYDTPWYASRLYAIWKALYTYRLRYDPNGGEGGPDEEVIEDVEEERHEFILNDENEPSLQHYKFLGWGLENSNTVISDVVATVDEPNVTVYAIWKKLYRYSLRYEAEGGTNGPEKEIAEDIEEERYTFDIKQEPIPQREGFDFGGWATESDSEVPISQKEASSTNPDISVWAIWIPLNTYIIHYDANGGSNAPDDSIERNTRETSHNFELKQDPKPERSGYEFLGWGATEESSTVITEKRVYDDEPEITVYAIWKKLVTYKLNYYANGGDGGPEPDTFGPCIDDSHVFDLKPDPHPTWVKHVFKGWGESSDSTKPIVPPIKEVLSSKPEVYVYAIWQELYDYTLTYYPNGDNVASEPWPNPEEKLNQEEDYTFDPLSSIVPSRRHYKFIGWCDDPDRDPPRKITKMTATPENRDVNVYAIWKELYTYTLTYDANANGDTSVKNLPGEQKQEDQEGNYAFPLNYSITPTRDHYKFVGWGKEYDSTKKANKITATPDNRNVTAFAIWRQLYTYKLIYDNNALDATGGPPPQTEPDVDGNWTFRNFDYTIEHRPERPHYKFIHWSDKWDSTQKANRVIATPDNPEVYVYAVWEKKNEYTVTYYLNDFDGDSKAEWDSEPSVIAPEKITIIGKSRQVKIIDIEENSYTFNLILEPQIHRTGYTFLGWHTNQDEKTRTMNSVTAKKASPDISVFAVWKKHNRYVLTYYLNDYNDNNKATWEDHPQSIVETEPNSKIFRVIEDDKREDSFEFTLAIAPPPNRNHYDFVGWNKNQEATSAKPTAKVTSTSPEIDVYAVWKKLNRYTLTYYLNDSDGDSTAEWDLLSDKGYYQVVHEDEIKDRYSFMPLQEPQPSRYGYTFIGWNEKQDAESKQSPIIAEKNKPDKIVYAVWRKKNKYTLTYYLNDPDGLATWEDHPDSISDNFKVTTGLMDENFYEFELVVQQPRPSRTGYTFEGWSTNQDATRPTTKPTIRATRSNPEREVYAVWKPLNTYTLSYSLNDLDEDSDNPANEWRPDPDPDKVGTPPDYKITKRNQEADTYRFRLVEYPRPSRPHYKFKGWAERPTIRNTFVRTIDATKAKPDVVAYAIWDKKKVYTLTYNLNDAEDSDNPASWVHGAEYVVNSGEQDTDTYRFYMIKEPAPHRDHYKFEGWDESPTIKVRRGWSVEARKAKPNIIVYAIWKKLNIYTLTYYLNDNDTGIATWEPASATETTDEDKVVKTIIDHGLRRYKVTITDSTKDDYRFELIDYPPYPSRPGYNFKGWGFNSESKQKQDFIQATKGNYDKEVYAIWERTYDYSLTYDANGGTGEPHGEVDSVSGLTAESYSFTIKSQKPCKDGYEFVGWGSHSNAGMDEVIKGGKVVVTKDNPHTVIYAIWAEIHTYSLIYDPNGGDANLVPETQNFYTTEDSHEFTPFSCTPRPEKPGCTFIGWGGDRQAITPITSRTATLDEPNVTIYAMWDDAYTLFGVVKNALNGNPITGVVCNMVFRVSDPSGSATTIATRTATSASDGSYEVTTLHPNVTYTVEISANGFDSESFLVSFSPEENPAQRDFVLNPSLEENQFFRAILEWDDKPNDIDTHIRDINASPQLGCSNNTGDFIHWEKKEHIFDNGAELTLDVDNTQGYGPETVTLSNNKNVAFVYYVVNYSTAKNIDNPNSNEIINMSKTNVRVRVKVRGTITETITIHEQDTNYLIWNVFKYENGHITILDTYEYPFS